MRSRRPRRKPAAPQRRPTTLPIREQFAGGMLEVLTQSFLLAALLYYWVNHPRKRWLNWGLGALLVLVLLMSIMGFVVALQQGRAA